MTEKHEEPASENNASAEDNHPLTGALIVGAIGIAAFALKSWMSAKTNTSSGGRADAFGQLTRALGEGVAETVRTGDPAQIHAAKQRSADTAARALAQASNTRFESNKNTVNNMVDNWRRR